MKDFVNLHTHSIFSIGDSLIRIPDLFNKVKELGQSAIALTDHSTLAGAWDGLQEAKKTGVKFIIGSEFNFVNNLADEKEKLKHIVLIAKNHQGYKNLLKLLKKANENNIIAFKKTYPRLDWNLLEQYSEGLLCGTACSGGIIGQLINIRKPDEAKQQAIRLKNIFGDNLYFEIMPNALKRQVNQYNDYMDQQLVNTMLIQWGKELNVKLVPTCNAHYLNKEDAEAHDVILAISSGQPIESNNRLRYPVPEFYLKSRDEVVNFFKRLYKEEAEEWADNSVYFADQCEFPEWIDPAYSNPSKKELPEFPVHKQPDFSQFKNWLNDNPDLINKGIESNYVIYKAYQKLNSMKLDPEKYAEYDNRIKYESEVWDLKDINGYMLMVSDYVNWSRNTGIPTGIGRGCLTADAQVLTEEGFKNLSDIKIGDLVYTHTGKLQKVLNTFKYNVLGEKLISIKNEHSFGNLILTQDHKIYGQKSVETQKYLNSNIKLKNKVKRYEHPVNPEWFDAKSLYKNDIIFTTYPVKNNKTYLEKIDMSLFVDNIISVNQQDIIYNCSQNEFSELSFHQLSKKTKISRNGLQTLYYKGIVKNSKNPKNLENYNILNSYLIDNYNINIDEWRNKPIYQTKKLDRYFSFEDLDFCYILGRWIGDGWIKSNGHEIGFAFHQNDITGINKIKYFFESKGYYVSERKHKTKKLVQLIIIGKPIKLLFKYLFPNYLTTSSTKYIPDFFRKFNYLQLLLLMRGLLDSDGSVEGSYRENIDTTSKTLALQIKEALLYLGIKSSISIRKPFKRGSYSCKIAYKIRFSGLDLDKKNSFSEAGYYSKILETTEIETDYVYDIQVENDASYLTSNGVVHNSAGGSLIAYLLDIHKADSIKYNLIFERFYNKDKDAASDVDCDFSKLGKELIENYICNKYSSERYASISNFLQLTPKPYVKAIARVFRYGGDFKTAVKIGNEIASIIPDDIHSVVEAFEKSPLLNEYAKQYPEIKKYAKHIGNIYIAYATHAAGKVISKRDLDEIVPLRIDREGNVVLEYEKERVEKNGLVKIDILGLETLDIIENCYKLITKNGKTLPKEPFDYEIYDQKTYDLISSGNTFGVFQLGTSGGTIELCKKMKPSCIMDLALINALARPAAAAIRQSCIDRKHGVEKVELLHPSLERAFGFTYGLGLFDDSLMFLAQDVAGWTFNEADRLRKFTKDKGKNKEMGAKLRAEFIKGTIQNGYEEKLGIQVWDDVIQSFGAYGFCLSHAVFYSFLGFQTAYLKAHYLVEFLVSNLMSESNSGAKSAKDNILKIKQELRASGVKILPPDLNKSEMTYSILDDKHLLTGFESLKFMGKDAIPEILRKRPFTDFFDFISRVEPSKVKMPSILALIASGCLDGSGLTRKQMFLYAADYRKKLQLFKERTIDPNKTFVYPFPEIGEWSVPELHAQEQYYLGEGLTGNPFEVYAGFLNKLAINFSQLMSEFSSFPTSADKKNIYIPRDYGVIQGIVESFFTFKVKKAESKIYGQEMAKMVIKDPWGNSLSCTLFPDALTSFRATIKKLKGGRFVIEPGIGLHLTGHLNEYEGQVNLVYQDVLNVCGLPQRPTDLKPKKVTLKIPNERKKAKKELEIADVIEEYEEILSENGVIEEEALAEEELWQEIESSQPTLEMDD